MNALAIQQRCKPKNDLLKSANAVEVISKNDERLEQVTEQIDPKVVKINKMVNNSKNRREEWV